MAILPKWSENYPASTTRLNARSSSAYPADSINLYAKLFFDVIPRLQDESYIWRFAITPEMRRGNADTARARTARKILAFEGGKLLIDRLYGNWCPNELHEETVAEGLSRHAEVANLTALADLCNIGTGQTAAERKAHRDALAAAIEGIEKKCPGFRKMKGSAMRRGMPQAIVDFAQSVPPVNQSAGLAKTSTPAAPADQSTRKESGPPDPVKVALDDVGAWLMSNSQQVAESSANCRPGSLPDQQLCAAPPNVEHFERRMTSLYDRETLLRTGCFLRGSAEQPRLMDGLRTPGAPVLVLKDQKKHIVRVIANGRRPSFRPMLHDFLIDDDTRQRMSQFGNVLIIADSLGDAIRWRALGLGAVLTFDLARTSRTEWPALSKRLQLVSGKMDFIFVVPAWDPATWALKSPAARAKSLVRSGKLLRLFPSLRGSMANWDPPAAVVKVIQEACGALNSSGRIDAMRRSLGEHLFRRESKAYPCGKAPSEAVDYASARRRFVSVLEGDLFRRDSTRAAAAREVLLAAADAEFVAPLIQQAADCIDVTATPLRYLAATTTRRFFELDAIILEKMACGKLMRLTSINFSVKWVT